MAKRLPSLIALNIAAWVSLSAPAIAQPRVGGLVSCTLGTLSGTYGYSISGFDGTTPVANYGLFTSDGNGNLSGSATLSGGGTIVAVQDSGSYTMTPGCTGTAIFQNSLGQVAHLALTVNSNGGDIEFVETDSGTTVAGSAQPVAPTCDANSFSGPYTYAVSGWLAFQGGFVPYADAGRVVPNGQNGFTGKSTLSSGGIVERRTFSGTYSVGANCSGTSTSTDNLGNTGTIALTVVNNGQQVLFLYTSPGSVVAGRAYRGQYTCNNSSVSGPFQYSINGFGVSPGVIQPVAYAGELTANGSGSITGADAISQNGVVNTRTISANYSVNSDCSGSEVVTDSLGETANVDFFLTDQGALGEFIQTTSGLVIAGQAEAIPSGTCTASTVGGAYGYALEGWFYTSTGVLGAVADAGQDTSDGNGHFNGATTTSFGGTIEPRTLSGTYTTNSDCSGTSTFTDSLGNTAHFRNTVSPDGARITSIETDPGTIITNFALHQFTPSSAAIVNDGSFAPNVAPGSIIAIFGAGFAPALVQAMGSTWPTQLGTTQVLVNGTAIPLYYVSPGQIDAQLPVNLAPGPAQLVVSVGGSNSATVNFTVLPAAPGFFLQNGGAFLRAIAVDFTASPGGVLVTPATPARPGDVLVVYLTGGGAVNPAGGAWTSGAISPPGQSPVTAVHSATIGGMPAAIDYLGLTQGYIGLYQLNVHVPLGLPTGDHTLVVTVNGKASSSALISVLQ